MRPNVIPHESEIYRCPHCNKPWKFSALHGAWVCPDCGKNISIRITVATHRYECQRVRPEELNPKNIIFISLSDSYEILNITKEKNGYNLALKGYGTHRIGLNDFVTRIIGFWQD